MKIVRGPRLGGVLLGLGLGLTASLSACNQRFAFDESSLASGSGGDQSATGGAGTPTGGAGASGGVIGVGGVGSRCGSVPACPSNLHCVANACQACAADGDCTEPNLPRCDPKRHRCVACVASTDCGDGFSCDTLANRCLRTCKTKADCPTDAHGCDEQRGVCYQCDEDRECALSTLGLLCAVDGSGCVQCRSDADCPDQHCDQLTGRCVECRDFRDCDSGLCDPAKFVCSSDD